MKTMADQAVMNRTQRHVFDQLLAMGGARPTMKAGLVDALADHLVDNTRRAVADWTGSRLFISKSSVTNTLRCEGLVLAQEATPMATMVGPTAVGIVAHRAVQIAYTHPTLTLEECVQSGLEASVEEERFAEFWDSAGTGRQSDLLMQMLSKTVAFIDSFPPLLSSWTARFEEGFQAPLETMLLGARCDLVLGRPKTDLRQTMFLADLKTGALSDHHFDEAMFYALVATLHYGVAPFRSTVYSLASYEWSDPDVTEDRLFTAADKVIETATKLVGAKSGRRDVDLTAGPHCRFCPARNDCSSFDPDAKPATVSAAPAPMSFAAVSSTGTNATAHEPSVFDIED